MEILFYSGSTQLPDKEINLTSGRMGNCLSLADQIAMMGILPIQGGDWKALEHYISYE